MTAPIHVFLYVAVLTVFGLHLYYDWRARRFPGRPSRRSAAHCARCDALYAVEAGDGLHACPRCGHANAKLRF